MKDKIYLISINVALTLTFILSLNFVSGIVLLFKNNQDVSQTEERRYLLPNYDDNRELAKINFKEFNQLKAQYQPYIGWTRKPFEGKTITINSDGNRVHENNFSNGSNPKVHFFGGSTVWGTGVVDDGTIPAMFSSISGTPSYNQGESGHISRQSISKLINLLAKKTDVDLVIFYDGVNDIYTNCRQELELNDHVQTVVIRNTLEAYPKLKEKLDKEQNTFSHYLDQLFLANTKALIRIIRKQNSKKVQFQEELVTIEKARRKNVDNSLVCDNSKERAQKAAEILIKNWELAYHMAKVHGIQFIAVLQPVASIGNPTLDHLEFSEERQEVLLQYQYTYPIIKEIIESSNYKWILDYSNAFDGDEYMFIDHCHVSKNGNKLIAKRLFEDIKTSLDTL